MIESMNISHLSWEGGEAKVSLHQCPAMPLAPPGPRTVYSVLGAKLVTFKSHSVVSENELRHNPFSAATLINDEMVLTN